MLPDFNRLKIFYFIFTRQSIAAAAEALHITPSAVSQQLKKLEDELKLPLFTRSHKRMVPTEAGARLFIIVKPFVHRLETGLQELNKSRAIPFGLLKIGVPVEFGINYMPGIIAAFRTRYADVTFFLKLGRPSTLLPMIDRGELDFAFVDAFPTKSQSQIDFGDLSTTPVFEEQVVLACSQVYYQAHLGNGIALENLSRQSFISQEGDARALGNWFGHHFGKHPGQLNIVLTVESHQAVVSSIKHHLGLGIIVPDILWQEIARGEIIPIRTKVDQAVNKIFRVQLKDKTLSFTEKAFLAHFQAEMEENRQLKRLRPEVSKM